MSVAAQPALMRDALVVAPVFPPPLCHFARALEEAGRLRALATGYVYQPAQAMERVCLLADRLLGLRITGTLRRRVLTGVDSQRCRRALLPEIVYDVGRRLPLVRRLSPFRHHWYQHDRIDRFAAECLLDEDTRWVFGREDGALHSFRRAREMGARTVYELPTAHYATVRRILEREEAEFPRVCRRPGVRDLFTPAQLEHKDAELACADHIIVGSSFVRQSLTEAGYHSDAVTVLPSACEGTWRAQSIPHEEKKHRLLVLHVGYLSLRKGTHRLLRAWKRLGAYRSHRLRLIGDMCLSPRFLKDYQGCYEHVPRLRREQLPAHYSSAGLFALPAAAEGFATVILEALSCGLPVVASRNSGAEGFLEHGKEGLLHDFEDEDGFCTQLDWMLSHPRERAEMSRNARAKAAVWTWSDYRRSFLQAIDGLAQP